jgi:hypothetical protein
MALPVTLVILLSRDTSNWNTTTWIVMFLCIIPIQCALCVKGALFFVALLLKFLDMQTEPDKGQQESLPSVLQD